jgi:hypothetical protein
MKRIGRLQNVALAAGLLLASIPLFPACDSTKVPSDAALLSWQANSEPDLAGYKVYWGTTSGQYPNSHDAQMTDTPTKPSYMVTDLAKGTYYFVVTAYDTAGNESTYSNVANKTIH